MTHRDGLPRFSASGLYQLNCTPTIVFPVSSVGGEVPAMRGIAKRRRRRPKALVSRRSGRVCGPSEGVEQF